MLIDAHAHLDHYDEANLNAVLTELEQHQILTLTNAMHPNSFRRNLEIARRSQWVVPSMGVHPWCAAEYVDQLAEMKPLLEQSPLIGEIGLDYLWVDQATIPAQHRVFEFFLEAAYAQNKVVNLHTKDAEAEVLSLLKQYQIRRAIVHWYSGPLDILQDMIAADYYFTVGVQLAHSAHIQTIAQAIPLDRLLVETDNPGGLEWLTKEVGYPHHLILVIEMLAALKQVPFDQLTAKIEENCRRLMQDDLVDYV